MLKGTEKLSRCAEDLDGSHITHSAKRPSAPRDNDDGYDDDNI